MKEPRKGSKLAMVLEHLIRRGSITQREAAVYYNSWRLSDQIMVLKDDYGHDIETKPEKHNGGIHGRYIYLGRKEAAE